MFYSIKYKVNLHKQTQINLCLLPYLDTLDIQIIISCTLILEVSFYD